MLNFCMGLNAEQPFNNIGALKALAQHDVFMPPSLEYCGPLR
jgi:hypothetical protein